MCTYSSPVLAQSNRIIPVNPLGSACDGCKLHLTTSEIPSATVAPYSVEWEVSALSNDLKDDIHHYGTYDPARGLAFPVFDHKIESSSTGLWLVKLTMSSLKDRDSIFVYTDTITTSCYKNTCPQGDFSFTQLNDSTAQLTALTSATTYNWSAFDWETATVTHNQSITGIPNVSELAQAPVFVHADEGHYFAQLLLTQSNGCSLSCQKVIHLAGQPGPSNFAPIFISECSVGKISTNLSTNVATDWELRIGSLASTPVSTMTSNNANFILKNVNNLLNHSHRRVIRVRRITSSGTVVNRALNLNAVFLGEAGQSTHLSTLVSSSSGQGQNHKPLPLNSFQSPAGSQPYRVFISGELVVDANYTFKGIAFYMGDGAKIKVLPGISFNTEDCFFKPQGFNVFQTLNDPASPGSQFLECNCLWNGIDVKGSYAVDNSVFDRANEAIQLVSNSSIPTLSAKESFIYRSQIGVRAEGLVDIQDFKRLTFWGEEMSYANTCSYTPQIFNHSFAGLASLTGGAKVELPYTAIEADRNVFFKLANGFYSYKSDLSVGDFLVYNIYRPTYSQGTNAMISGNGVVAIQGTRNSLQVRGYGGEPYDFESCVAVKNFITVIETGGFDNSVVVEDTWSRSQRGITINRPVQNQSSFGNISLIQIKNNAFYAGANYAQDWFNISANVPQFPPFDDLFYGIFINHGIDGTMANSVEISGNFTEISNETPNIGLNKALIVNQVSGTNIDLDIRNNHFTNYQLADDGILLNNVENGRVRENSFLFLSEADISPALKGAIHVVSGTNNSMTCNNIEGGKEKRDDKNSGIILDFTTLPEVYFNRLDGLDRSLQVENSCVGTQIKQNDFVGEANVRMFFGENAILGTPWLYTGLQEDNGNYFSQSVQAWDHDVQNHSFSMPVGGQPDFGFFWVNGNENEQMPSTYYATNNGSALGNFFSDIHPFNSNAVAIATDQDCAELPAMPDLNPGTSTDTIIIIFETTVGNALETAIRSFNQNGSVVTEETLLSEAVGLLILRELLKNQLVFEDQSLLEDLVGQIDALKLEEPTLDNYAEIVALSSSIDSLLAWRAPVKNQRLVTFNSAAQGVELELDPAAAEKFVLEQMAQLYLGSGINDSVALGTLSFVASQCIAQYGQSAVNARILLAMTTGKVYPNVDCETPSARIALNPPKKSTQKLISLSPNPAEEYTTINSDVEVKVWGVYQVTGQALIFGTGNRIATNNLPKGVYFITASLANGQRSTVKLIVNH
jgi:hypothetical protein